MSITVEFTGLKSGKPVALGTMEYDGRVLRCSPDNARFQSILDQPIRDHATGEALYSDEHPEAFLRNLQYTYRAAYCRASEATDDGSV